MNLELADKKDYAEIKRLYKTAFPKEERAPFFMIKRKALSGKADVLVAREDGVFIGFLYLVCHKDLVYLFYFAIDDEQRQKGYGSKFLKQVQEHYKGKRLFLAREQLDESADNYEQRRKRHAFYLKNGFEDIPLQIREASVVYDVMGVGGPIQAKEYDELIENWSGRLWKRMVKMEAFENELD